MSAFSRAADLSWLEPPLSWLSKMDAGGVFERANCRLSWQGLALDEQQFELIETEYADEVAPARAWLAERIQAAERLFVIFSEDEVCTMPAPSFLEHWQNMFGPGRDDVLITNEREEWVLFYHHDDKFHFGRLKRT